MHQTTLFLKIRKGQNTLWLSIAFLLLSFPLFYFVYKYGNPEPLAHDYFQYYHLYQRLAVGDVIAPHNMRFVGAFFVHLLYKLNFYYNTQTFAEQYEVWGFLKQVYFCAVLFNYMCVVITAVQLQKIISEQLQIKLGAIVGGMLYLLAFGTLFYSLMPLTDAFSILLFVLFFRAYLKQSKLVYFILALLIFQREYLLIAIASLAGLDFYFERKRYQIFVLCASLLAFAIYYILRKTLFYTPHLDQQSQAGYMISVLAAGNVNWVSYLKSLLLGNNLLFLYFLLLFYKLKVKIAIDKRRALIILALFIQVNIVTLAGGHGNNMSRYFYLLSPLLIFYLISEAQVLLKKVE